MALPVNGSTHLIAERTEDDFVEQVGGRAVQHAVQCAQDHGRRLVEERNDDGGAGQVPAVVAQAGADRRPRVGQVAVQRRRVAQRHVDRVLRVGLAVVEARQVAEGFAQLAGLHPRRRTHRHALLCRRASTAVCATHILGQLSLASLRGRLIEYQLRLG